MESTTGINISPLQGEYNYNEWSIGVTTVLKELELWPLISGEIQKPSVPTAPATCEQLAKYKALKECWDYMNAEATSKILSKVVPEIRRLVDWLKSAHDMWFWLKREFCWVPRVAYLWELSFSNVGSVGCVSLFVDLIKRNQRKLAHLGYPLQDWVLATLLLKGLPKEWDDWAVAKLNALDHSFVTSWVEDRVTSRGNGQADGTPAPLTLDDIVEAVMEEEARQQSQSLQMTYY